MVDEVPDRPVKGRGAAGNRTGRFEPHARVAVDDGWGDDGWGEDGRGAGDEPWSPPPLRTTLTADHARTVIARNDSPDVPFAQSVNPYRGCEHGCVYCFARPTHAYLGLSAGLDFEARLFHKPDAPELLDAELRKPGYRPRTIALGSNTDPYQPVERGTGLTRRILEVLSAFRHPVGIVTKSALVARDIDVLAPMAERGLAQVGVSITTLDRDLARTMEPRAATPTRRLETIRRLSDAGIPVAVLFSPMIPALNDHEMERVLEAAADAGAVAAGTILLRLPLEIADLFTEWVEAHVPGRARHVLSLIRQSRGGATYRAEFGARMKGDGPYADMLQARFAKATRRLGLTDRWPELDVAQFRPPPRAGDQLALF